MEKLAAFGAAAGKNIRMVRNKIRDDIIKQTSDRDNDSAILWGDGSDNSALIVVHLRLSFLACGSGDGGGALSASCNAMKAGCGSAVPTRLCMLIMEWNPTSQLQSRSHSDSSARSTVHRVGRRKPVAVLSTATAGVNAWLVLYHDESVVSCLWVRSHFSPFLCEFMALHDLAVYVGKVRIDRFLLVHFNN